MNTLFFCLMRLAQLQGDGISRLSLQEAADAAEGGGTPEETLAGVSRSLQSASPQWLKRPDPSAVPSLLYSEERGWGVLIGVNGKRQWVAEWFDENGRKLDETVFDSLAGFRVARIRLSRPFSGGASPVFRLIRDEFFSSRKSLVEVLLGGAMVNLVALGTSLYTMQVYDRVVPTGALSTLQVLTFGVFLAIVFEFTAKLVRSKIYDRLIDQVDRRLARSVYLKFLSVRLDQLPASVGALAAQMRGYETVRGFLGTATMHALVDVPFVVVFVFVIAAVGGWLVIVPLSFFLVAIAVGLYYRRQVEALTRMMTHAGNLKTGLLVEAIEGAETIKSGQGGWRMLSTWMRTSDEARDHDLAMRALTERSQYLTALLQQLSYVLLVASGALLIGKAGLTMGSLIACSILSGRILAPVGAIPNLLVQWGHSKAALQGLDKLWALEEDHHRTDNPIILDRVDGEYRFERVEAQYNQRLALTIPGLHVRAGEKIGVLGPVGAGKTTLLRLMSGMYKPQEGMILLDGVDLSLISKPVLAEHMGYLQQEGRLFAGTLRDNLILGLRDPGDPVIIEAARKSGLLQAVIQQHPQGLQQPIFEGGLGLSGGQRQLVNLTRVLLRAPRIWLLDEPTASMDQALEIRVRAMLQSELKPEHTLVLITHKPEMLALVDRIIVVVNHQILMDGPKQSVLASLQRGAGGDPRVKGLREPSSGMNEEVAV